MKIIIFYLTFSILLAYQTSSASAETISGRITSLQTTKDINTTSLTNLELKKFEESLVVSSKNNGLSNAIVYIKKVPSSLIPATPNPIKLDQIANIFFPRVVPMQTGGEITIVNSDKIFHNVHAYFRGENLFIDNLPDYKQETKHIINRQGVVSMKCEVHLAMLSYVVVLQNPFFTTTDQEGNYTIKDLPPGEYKLISWHELLGIQEKKIVVKKGKNLQGKNFIYEHITSISPRWY